jgi:hypothetical protein
MAQAKADRRLKPRSATEPIHDHGHQRLREPRPRTPRERTDGPLPGAAGEKARSPKARPPLARRAENAARPRSNGDARKTQDRYIEHAPIHEYGILGLDALTHIDPSQDYASNATAQLLSRVFLEHQLES